MKTTIRQFLVIFNLPFIIISCTTDQTEITQAENELKIDSVESDEEKQPENTNLRSDLTPFPLKNLDINWTRLTETDSTFIIYNSCSGGNKMINIDQSNSPATLLLYGQQEDSRYKIISTKVAKNGTIHFEVENEYTDEPWVFKMKWVDESQGLATWHSLTNVEYFVSSEFKSNYQIIDQPCIECWGPDECDENE